MWILGRGFVGLGLTVLVKASYPKVSHNSFS